MATVLDTDGYTVAIVCPLPVELTAVTLMLDEEYQQPPRDLDTNADDNTYTYRSINGHAVVIANFPRGSANARSAAHLINPMTRSFRQLRVALLVGVGGGIPVEDAEPGAPEDVRLGDIVVGCVNNKLRTVIDVASGEILPPPERRIAGVLSKLEVNRRLGRSPFAAGLKKCTEQLLDFKYPGNANDTLYKAAYEHVKGRPGRCDGCASDYVVTRLARQNDDPQLHFGVIACVPDVVRDAVKRDTFRVDYGAICVEMEAAGILGRQNCLVIRGISDYADSHKNDDWQKYAAATAAAVMREILYTMAPGEVNQLASVGASSATQAVVQTARGPTATLAAIDPPPPQRRLELADSRAQYLVRRAADEREAATSSAAVCNAISTFNEAITRLQTSNPGDIWLAHATFGLVECYIDLADNMNNEARVRLGHADRGEAELRLAMGILEEGGFADLRFRGTVYSAVLAAQRAMLRANRDASTSPSLSAEERNARGRLMSILEHDIYTFSPGGMEYKPILENYLNKLQ